VIAALLQVLKPSGILWKNDSARAMPKASALRRQRLWRRAGMGRPGRERREVRSAGAGRAEDRLVLRPPHEPRAPGAYVQGKRVLDLFSYIGGWGVQAAAFGASEVFCVDASGFALDGVERNASTASRKVPASKATCSKPCAS
jgi:23S rRNA (cytosine1962-C5)-methyltransferase